MAQLELRVKGDTDFGKLGVAVAKSLEETREVTITAMGEKAVYRAVKGIIAAQSYLAATAKSMSVKVGYRGRKDSKTDTDITLIIFLLRLIEN